MPSICLRITSQHAGDNIGNLEQGCSFYTSLKFHLWSVYYSTAEQFLKTDRLLAAFISNSGCTAI